MVYFRFPFSVQILTTDSSSNKTAVSFVSFDGLQKLDFEGDFNPMMAMMIKGPISKFIETLASNMHKL